MPYISPEKRKIIDPAVDNLHKTLVGLELDHSEDNNFEGNINYVITRLLRLTYGKSYRDINDSMGVLFCTALEHYRTFAGPHEDQKKFENGDVDPSPDNIVMNEVTVETVKQQTNDEE